MMPSLRLPAIILVDDDPDARSILRRLLTLFADGYQLVAVSAGAAALAALDSYQVPLVITDYHMHGMDGLELTRQVKARLPDTIVAITSAADTRDLAREASAAGADHVLVKPFAFDQVAAIVQAALERT